MKLKLASSQHSSSPLVFLVGPLPPPVRGMPSINLSVLEILQKSNLSVVTIDISTARDEMSLASRAARFPKAIRGLFTLVTTQLARRRAFMYLSPSSRFGQLYDLAYVVIARLRRIRLIMHHHSFAYIDQPTYLSRYLIQLAGSDCTHVCLCPCMSSKLSKSLGAQNVQSISNAVFLMSTAPQNFSPRTEVRRIGFLGTITVEKGAMVFLDIAASAVTDLPTIDAQMAGSFDNRNTEKLVREQIARTKNVSYLGPVYGDSKRAFFSSVDVLILPTTYVNEAEPLVILEALANGIPVISTSRGCIADLLLSGGGLVLDHSSFTTSALDQLRHWYTEPQEFQRESTAARRAFTERVESDRQTWEQLHAHILDS